MSFNNLSKENFQGTLELIGRDPHAFSDFFYEQVEHEIPSFKEIFKNTDLRLQKLELIKGFLQMFSLYDQTEELDHFLFDLGLRHVCYGVDESHYEKIIVALMASLRYVHGESWNKSLESSWELFFSHMTSRMIQGAQSLSEAS